MLALPLLLLVALAVLSTATAVSSFEKIPSCRFAKNFKCSDFKDPKKADEYLSSVMYWEGQFAQAGVAYDPASGYTYDGHPLNYTTGELYGEPHLFSAPSKESIHVGILALALDGNPHALEFVGGFDRTIELLTLKINGYLKFNENFPGYGCWTPWVSFDQEKGIFVPIDSWTKPYYKVPGLDNGEWFWAIYAVSSLLNSKYKTRYPDLAAQYESFLTCQKNSAKMIYYRGEGNVSATVYILDPFAAPTPSNYVHCDGLLNDPYEGETMTQILYLFSQWDSEEERDLLWQTKRGLFQKVDYQIPASLQRKEWGPNLITVQKGWWFSTHEQWKTLLLPYLSRDLPLVRKVFRNAEKARVFDAYASGLPGLQASINDVTDGSEDIPDYASACGVQSLAFEPILRRDLMTPYGAYGLFLHDQAAGLCWYNNMLLGPRMQSKFGSTEAINANGTEISPLTTWDSKITTVLAMLGGIGAINERALRQEPGGGVFKSAYERFVYVVDREHRWLFGDESKVHGEEIPFVLPAVHVPTDALSDWSLSC